MLGEQESTRRTGCLTEQEWNRGWGAACGMGRRAFRRGGRRQLSEFQTGLRWVRSRAWWLAGLLGVYKNSTAAAGRGDRRFARTRIPAQSISMAAAGVSCGGGELAPLGTRCDREAQEKMSTTRDHSASYSGYECCSCMPRQMGRSCSAGCMVQQGRGDVKVRGPLAPVQKQRCSSNQ